MPSFLDDISSFYGTGEKNEKGQTLEEFLKEYAHVLSILKNGYLKRQLKN